MIRDFNIQKFLCFKKHARLSTAVPLVSSDELGSQLSDLHFEMCVRTNQYNLCFEFQKKYTQPFKALQPLEVTFKLPKVKTEPTFTRKAWFFGIKLVYLFRLSNNKTHPRSCNTGEWGTSGAKKFLCKRRIDWVFKEVESSCIEIVCYLTGFKL